MNVNLAYGQGQLPVELPAERTTVIEPSPVAALPDERAAVVAALESPTNAAPLREQAKPTDRVCIIFTDITRATPNHRLIPWLLQQLAHVRRENITLLNSTGTHRPNTKAELEQMLTPEVVAGYRVVNHDAEDRAACAQVGTTRDGTPAMINQLALEADLRILTGFIEPHLFAGFSGGPKALLPGVAWLGTVMSNHGARHISDPNATWGVTDGNPLWEEMRDVALRCGRNFLLNVALNHERRITGVFAGDMLAAHKVGIEFVRRSAMQPVDAPFDLVVTTNSGYPLDLNLYQGVKGMSAAARIVKPGGTIILAAECREGVPDGSPCDRFLRAAAGPEEVLAAISSSGSPTAEQWQAQTQALIQRKAKVLVHSSLSDETLRAVHLTPCHDISAEVARRLAVSGSKARVAVLPQGPLTIPYLRRQTSRP
ncbi:MAG: nickel-dependent lactate racemase [Verrucomicrobia bacterium]|nr:nickel-dependent lactate racemase [Verrucomicrobiota bacterium]